MRNDYYHDFDPSIDPAFIIALGIGMIALVTISYFAVHIGPITYRCRRYRSAGNKAKRIADPHRRSGAAPKNATGLAIIMPSTSFDWIASVIYVIYAIALAHYYHGAGILQVLWNHEFTELTYFIVMVLCGTFMTPCVVAVMRVAQFISAKKIFLSTLHSGTRLHVYEEWGLYDKLCYKEFRAICRVLSRKEKCAVRAVVSNPNISEKTKLDRARSFILAQTNLKKKTKTVEFESILDSFVEYVYR